VVHAWSGMKGVRVKGAPDVQEDWDAGQADIRGGIAVCARVGWQFGRSSGVDSQLAQSKWVAAVITGFVSATEPLWSFAISAATAAAVRPVGRLHRGSTPMGMSEVVDQVCDDVPKEQDRISCGLKMARELDAFPLP
jgi:hypothetical protein